MNKKVVVAMSGGVDSSVAAYFLKECGYEVVGLFMRMGNIEDEPVEQSATQGCCSFEDACDARSVASNIGIPFYVLNFQKEFEKVIDYFCQEYTDGRTPNPCIICNQRLKFGKLLDFAQALNADLIATGHYARIELLNGRYILRKGIDKSKDQSYALAQLNQNQLSKIIFPLGVVSKEDVRETAKALNLKVKDKPESQEICFVHDNDYKRFLAERIKDQIKPGNIIDTAGNILTKHNGIQNFTIGQRKGLGIALGKPAYVVRIDPDSNTVVVGTHEDLLSKQFFVNNLNWVAMETLAQPIKVLVKIRYNHTPVAATIFPVDDSVCVEFEEPHSAVTPGQAAVFYDKGDDEVVLGAGWIMRE